MTDSRRAYPALQRSMKVLLLHNSYQQRGGEELCFEAERDLLRERGHRVSEHVVENHSIRPGHLALTGLKAVWNQNEYRRVRRRLREIDAEIVHVHNFFPLISPAVYYAAADEGVPVVQTLHNYRLLCPGGLLFRDGKPCEDCVGKAVPWGGVRHGCYRGSPAASAAVAAMAVTHRALGTWSGRVSAYIVLTEFARSRFVAGGFPESKLFLKPNFVHDAGQGRGDGGYAVYVGRLSEEKGVRVLLDAWRTVDARLPLKILGAGPLEPLVSERARSTSSIDYVGYRCTADVTEIIKRATALVLPSVCYEGLPRVIPEAFAAGTPVIASGRGAMESLVVHQKNGLKFAPGDATDLAVQVDWMLKHPADWQVVRENARAEYLGNYTPDRNYRLLMGLYTRVLARDPINGVHAARGPEAA